ncbi:MAG: oligosaccharide flippase family protein [Polyangiaceae bacterium]|nr:oligosaccharide flippase family protein [Polyangiaceae bacterium]
MSLARKAAGGFLWTTGATLGSRLLTIASTFVLTRYLAPAVQGEVNLAYVVVSTAGAATAFGVMQYVAARPKEGRATAFHGSLLVLTTGLAAMILTVALRHRAATWLDVPGLAQYVPGMAAAHYIERFQWVPRSLLVREMRFRTAGLRVAVGELIFAVSSVILAHLGHGGNAIVYGNILRSIAGVVFLYAVTNWRDHLEPARLTLDTMKKLLRFGVPFTIASVFRLGGMSWDNAFMGRRFDEATVGVYNQAYRLAELPATALGEQINDVLVPTFARITEADARTRGFLRSASLLSMLLAPMAAGMGVIAPTLVAVFYPESYQGVAPFLVVLTSISLTRSLSNLSGAFLQVVGRTEGFVVIDFLLAVTVLLFMRLLAPFGAVYSAVGVSAAFLLSVLFSFWLLRPDGIRVGAVLGAIVRPVLACVPMVAAVVGAQYGLAAFKIPAPVRLVLEIVVGAVAYIGAVFLVAGPIARDLLGLLKGLRRRKQEPDQSTRQSA